MQPSHELDCAAEPRWLGRLVHTPLVDLLRGRVTGRYDVRQEVASAGLPPQVSAAVLAVVRGTRLSRSEKIDVARELASHFADGLAVGRTPEELLVGFGSLDQAAALIRKAKLRQRPFAWQAWWVFSRLILVSILLAFVGYGVLAASYFLRHPTIARNYWQEVNQERTFPADERAWPLYREAGFLLERADDELLHFGFQHTPDDTDWPQLVALLDRHQTTLELTRRAAALPHLGYLFGDPEDLAASQAANKPWLIRAEMPLAEENKALMALNVGGMHLLKKLARLLLLDSEHAASQGDSERALQDLVASLSLSQQIFQPHALLVEELIGSAILQATLRQAGHLLATYPELFSDDQLRDLAHRIAGYRNGDLRIDLDAERLMFADLLQRLYSDDGDGSGQVTPAGIELLNKLSQGTNADFEPFMDPAFAALMASREEEREYFNEFIDEMVAARSGPPWTWNYAAIDAAQERIDRDARSASGRVRHMLTYLYAPAVGSALYVGERNLQVRDATLTAIALVLFHHRQGKWPDQLEDLVPGLLPAVPPDRFDGQPLRYTIRDDHPILYSIGNDYDDDGGRPSDPPIDVQLGIGPEPPAGTYPPRSDGGGDWILWPPLPEEAVGQAEM